MCNCPACEMYNNFVISEEERKREIRKLIKLWRDNHKCNWNHNEYCRFNNGKFKEEDGKLICLNFEEKIIITTVKGCTATYCKFNVKGKCIKKEILIEHIDIDGYSVEVCKEIKIRGK